MSAASTGGETGTVDRADADGDGARDVVAEARAFVGAPATGRQVARDPVNQPMINHWCQALDDRNPIYLDAEVAAATRHRGIVAPPGMLGTWTLDAVARDDGGPRDQVLRRLEQAGYTAVVATNYDHEYVRELRPGDHISETITVDDLSERKTTALGDGFFVTVRHDYHDQDGELVGVARMRLLKFQPAQRDEPPTPAPDDAEPVRAARPRPAITRDNAFFWEGVRRHQLLIQRCASCGQLRHPPRPMCGSCRSTEWDTVASTGRGTVHSYAVHHHPPLPGITTPHPVVLVDLDEGVRMISHTVDVDPADLQIGLAVEVVFVAVDDDLTLPLFRRRDGAAA